MERYPILSKQELEVEVEMTATLENDVDVDAGRWASLGSILPNCQRQMKILLTRDCSHVNEKDNSTLFSMELEDMRKRLNKC